MTQAHPVPDVHACGSLAVENMPSFSCSLIGAGKGHDQIQLRAGIDDPSDATKNPIHFAKRSESIDVNGLQAGGLRQQFFVVHDDCSPHFWKTNHDTVVSGLRQKTEERLQKVIASRSGFVTSGTSA